MNKVEALRVILRALEGYLIVVCNGMIGREAFSIADDPRRFYMIGSMGIAASIALGLAHCRPGEPVACVEGDGNTLMGLGNLAQVAADAPRRFRHVCLDNGAHASTGDQRTISRRIPLEQVALATGYRHAWRAESIAELEAAAQGLAGSEGPAFLLATVAPGTVPGIPRIDLDPAALTRRMRASARGGTACK